MLLLALLFEIVVQVITAETTFEARCHQTVYLPCNADFKGKDYFSVTWYKIQEKKKGIIRKSLKDLTEGLFDFPRNVSIDDQNSLVLSKVTPSDSGRYECAVSAKVGGQNVSKFVELLVPECELEETTVSMTTLNTQVTSVNCTDCSDSAQHQHLPLTWSLVGYGAVALTKILMSIFVIWVLHIWMRRKRRW